MGNRSTNLIDVHGLADWVATDKYKFWVKDLGLFHRMVDSWQGTDLVDGSGGGKCCQVTRGRHKQSRHKQNVQAEQLYVKDGMQDEVVGNLDTIASGTAIGAGMAAAVGLEPVAAAFAITSGVAWFGESLARATLDPDEAEWRDLGTKTISTPYEDGQTRTYKFIAPCKLEGQAVVDEKFTKFYYYQDVNPNSWISEYDKDFTVDTIGSAAGWGTSPAAERNSFKK